MNVYDIEYPYQIMFHMSKRTKDIFDEWLYEFIGNKGECWSKFRGFARAGSSWRPNHPIEHEYYVIYGFKTKEMMVTIKLAGILEETFDIFELR